MTDLTRPSLLHRAGWWRIAFACFAAFVLGAPAIAMASGADVNWGPEDFAFAGVMLAISGTVLEVILRGDDRLAYRIGAAIALGTCFIIIWVNAAVGIIGEGDDPVNLLFGGVIAVAMAGSIAAGFEARGMARAMAVTAAAQLLLFVLTQAWGLPSILGFTLFLTALWSGSALFFARASSASRPPAG